MLCCWVSGYQCFEWEYLDCVTLGDEAKSFSDTSGTTHRTTMHHIPEDMHLQQHCYENLKYCTLYVCSFRVWDKGSQPCNGGGKTAVSVFWYLAFWKVCRKTEDCKLNCLSFVIMLYIWQRLLFVGIRSNSLPTGDKNWHKFWCFTDRASQYNLSNWPT